MAMKQKGCSDFELCGSVKQYIIYTALRIVATAIAQAANLANHSIHFTAMNPTPFLALLQAFLSA
jgi:hypothetical protein